MDDFEEKYFDQAEEALEDYNSVAARSSQEELEQQRQSLLLIQDNIQRKH